MSRGLALTVALAALALVACREEAVVVGTATPTTEGATPTGGTPVPAGLDLRLGETARIGDAEVTVHGVRFDTGGTVIHPRDGHVWILVDATVVNTGDNDYALSALVQVAVRDQDAREYRIAAGPRSNGSFGGAIPPGDRLRGEAGFEIPLTTTTLQFAFKQAFGTAQARWNLPLDDLP